MTKSTSDLDAKAIENARLWANNPHIEEADRLEVQKLLDTLDKPTERKELIDRFYKNLEFGTGGIRAIMGMGLNRQNIYNIQKATQALCQVILKSHDKASPACVALSYDSRHRSYEFACQAACVLAGNGIKALIYKRMNPVALLSFSVRYHKACAGIMITASHNPPAYNGYKVFWSDGAQVTPPHDQEIINAFYAQEDFDQIKSMDFEAAQKEHLIEWVGEDVEEAYFKAIANKIINPKLIQEHAQELSIVYTPIHGTGLIPCQRVCDLWGFKNFHVVKEQAKPDGDFPTTPFGPNPENPKALAMAVDKMKEIKADIVFGTDPDTDRLGVAILHQDQVFYPNGNQIGILMLDYILEQLSKQKALPANSYIVKTIVTTPMLELIAQKYQIKVENTLTGFKWICGKINQIEKDHPQWNMLFATEESFGYMHHDYVRDKDAVSSLALMAEVALYHKTCGRNLYQALDLIYEKYGLCLESLLSLDYFGQEGAQKIERIMEYFRHYKESSFEGHKIVEIKDYKKGQAKNFQNDKVTPLDTPSSNVIGFAFEGGHQLFLRPSGTEPKIKFYIMMIEKEGNLNDKKERAQEKIQNFRQKIKQICDQS